MQKLWATTQFAVKGLWNFGAGGFEKSAQRWDDREMKYNVSYGDHRAQRFPLIDV